MSRKKNRTIYRQLEAMVSYLEQNKELLSNRGFTKDEGKWAEMAHTLNSVKNGPVKSAKEWKRVLSEWKYNTKKRFKANSKMLNDAEERLIRILSETPYEDIYLSEKHFIPVFPEHFQNTNYDTAQTESSAWAMKEEIQFDEVKVEHFDMDDYISSNGITEIEEESNPELMPTTRNFGPIKQNEIKEQAQEISKNPADIKDSTENIGEIEITNRYNRLHKIKRRKFRRTQNSLMTELRRNNDEMKKMYKYLGEAMFKLAESNCKIADSNCKIAESNEKLAEALNCVYKDKAK